MGDVSGRACLIVDDMISTGGTIATAVRALLDAGARPEIFVAGAAEQLYHRAIKGIWVCDTLPQAGEPDRTVVPVAPLIAAALEHIRQVHDLESDNPEGSLPSAVDVVSGVPSVDAIAGRSIR